jgi:hypothetical protein
MGSVSDGWRETVRWDGWIVAKASSLVGRSEEDVGGGLACFVSGTKEAAVVGGAAREVSFCDLVFGFRRIVLIYDVLFFRSYSIVLDVYDLPVGFYVLYVRSPSSRNPSKISKIIYI